MVFPLKTPEEISPLVSNHKNKNVTLNRNHWITDDLIEIETKDPPDRKGRMLSKRKY